MLYILNLYIIIYSSMKKILLSLLALPLFLFAGCGATDYRNELITIENELAKVAGNMEEVLTGAMTKSMIDGFDKEVYDTSISSLITSLDGLVTKTNELGAYDDDDSVQQQLLISINAVKYLLESDVPNVFTALSEKPEEADSLMSKFIEKVGAMQKYDDDLNASLKVFDAKHGIAETK